MKKTIAFLVLLLLHGVLWANPVDGLLERIEKGLSAQFKIEIEKSSTDFFELDQQGEKIVVRANNWVNATAGVNWYLKYHAGVHLSWNGMRAKLPNPLPAVKQRERRETDMNLRYDLNYCTYSYSMPFWDWERWEKEIDWMALHGINMPLALVGMEAVWYNVLKKLNYTRSEINEFISGPAFFAWWHMNNLEGWGGPNSDNWYKQQVQLQKRIIERMRQFGIDPVFPGYAGMVPNNAKEKLGLNVSDPGRWCGYRRPAFLLPTDPAFEHVSSLYYQEMDKLFGQPKYYGIDPFHEGGSVDGVDLALAGKAILKAMKKANPKAVWVIQAWQANPRPAMVDDLPTGDLLVLDLSSENLPMWGDKNSPWYRKNGYGKHEWLYCMLLNFGGNVGLHGKMDRVINSYYDAKAHSNGKTLRGVGITMEGIENNPVMYELLLELPWRNERFTKSEWLKEYIFARYGRGDQRLEQAWQTLSQTVYGSTHVQEGTTESVLCARPAEVINSVSSWGTTKMNYPAEELRKAAEEMLDLSNDFRGNNNFEYDLVDVVRQTFADHANGLLKEITEAYQLGNRLVFDRLSNRFLKLILAQDKLLSSREEFMLGRWLEQAKKAASNDSERRLYEWNARTLITTWGDRQGANEGGLRDYSHREWSGLLGSLYYSRWKAWFELLQSRMDGVQAADIDWYAMEESWARQQDIYPTQPQVEPIHIAKALYWEFFR